MNERKSPSQRDSLQIFLFSYRTTVWDLCLGRTGGPKCADGLKASTHLKWNRIDRAKVGGGRKEESGREKDMMTGLRVTWWWKDRRWDSHQRVFPNNPDTVAP